MEPIAITDVCEIKRRAEACGVSLRDLAERAGVSPSTAYTAARKRGATMRGGTLRRLNAALTALEEQSDMEGEARKKLADQWRRRADEIEGKKPEGKP